MTWSVKASRLLPAAVLLALAFALVLSPGLRAAEEGVKGQDGTTEEAAEAPAPAPTGEVRYAVVEGIVNPVMAEFLMGAIDGAEDDGAEALVIQLDTPGGLDLSMRKIVKRMLGSRVPVVVYVAPPGSRAASAGVFLAYASHVAAMAPGTNMGSASPVAMGGGEMDETMKKKVENDAVAYIRSIASEKGRNAEWAEKAVREAVNITAEEALELGVIDLIAEDRTDLMEKLHGRTLEVSGAELTLDTRGAEVTEVEMGLRHRVLNAISNPNVAYILMMIGLIGLYFELSNPGAILPGVAGAICLVLAFYAFQTLPINYAGLILIGLAVIFFIVEISVVSYGLLTIAGIISLVMGSLMLFESPAPFMRVSLTVILPVVIFMTGFILFTMYYAVTLHRRVPVSGGEGIVGLEGSVIDDFTEGEGGYRGSVFVEGEYWDAVSSEPLSKGDGVTVTEMKGLVLTVERTR